MSREKFREQVFVTTRLTVSGEMIVPYGTSAPTLSNNGDVAVYHSSNVAHLAVRSGGSVFTIAFPTSSNGTVTLTVA